MSEAVITDRVEFEEFPKLHRLFRDITVTEKIDGTNAQIYIPEVDSEPLRFGSRNRWVTEQSDNYCFAKWGYQHADELRKLLGPGRHYGEWWGIGINRGYGRRDRTFSLFNSARWTEAVANNPGFAAVGVSVVPVLYQGPFSEESIREALWRLKNEGSHMVPGFMSPEGVVVFHEASRLSFKITLDNNDRHKWTAEVPVSETKSEPAPPAI